MTSTLAEAIEGFREMVALPFGWNTQAGALNNCGDASLAFEQFCCAAGVSAQKVAMIGLPEYVRRFWENRGDTWKDGELDCHVVVRCGDLFVDWTAAQYALDAGFPRVSARWELEAEGWELQEKAGPNP